MLHTLFTAWLLAAPALQGDKIVLTSGKVLSVDRVTSETYKEVTFKNGTTEGKKPAQEVKSVEHDAGATVLEDYATALNLMQDGDWTGAISTFNDVLTDDRVMGKERYAWVVQHTLYRQAQCYNALQDAANVGKTVDSLLSRVPDTFFYAPALRLKAQALADSGNKPGAKAVYEELAGSVQGKGLPERWARESELGLVQLDDSLKGPEKIKKLQGIVEKNRDQYPTVASGANVVIGTTMLQSDPPDFDGAEKFFKDILEGGQADDTTAAAAWSGLGDVAYQRGIQKEDAKQADPFLLEAALDHLRVILMYKDQVGLVPRSLFYASRALTRRTDDTSRKQGVFLASFANTKYPHSTWTAKLLEELNMKPAASK